MRGTDATRFGQYKPCAEQAPVDENVANHRSLLLALEVADGLLELAQQVQELRLGQVAQGLKGRLLVLHAVREDDVAGLVLSHVQAPTLLHEDGYACWRAAPEPCGEVQRRLLLDVVVLERAVVLQLLAFEDQALLVRRDALLVLDVAHDGGDGVRGPHAVDGDGLALERLDEDLEAAWGFGFVLFCFAEGF